MNDPNVQAQLAPLWCWPWAGSSEAALQPPPLAPGILPEVTMRDFERYLRANAHHYEAFEKNLRAMQAAGSSRRISVTDITPGKLAAAALYCTLRGPFKFCSAAAKHNSRCDAVCCCCRADAPCAGGRPGASHAHCASKILHRRLFSLQARSCSRMLRAADLWSMHCLQHIYPLASGLRCSLK